MFFVYDVCDTDTHTHTDLTQTWMINKTICRISKYLNAPAGSRFYFTFHTCSLCAAVCVCMYKCIDICRCVCFLYRWCLYRVINVTMLTFRKLGHELLSLANLRLYLTNWMFPCISMCVCDKANRCPYTDGWKFMCQ